MQKILSLFILSSALADAVPPLGNALIKASVDSIRIQATTKTGATELPLSLVTKKDVGIRATIHIPGKLTRAVVLFNGEKLYLLQELAEHSVRELTGDEAAKNLFEMLAINPDFHFRPGEPNYDISILNGYHIEIIRDKAESDTATEKPLFAKLYRKTDSELELMRTIQYIDFFPQKDKSKSYYQPQKILFVDHQDASSGEIIIDKVSYNIGVGDFVFQLPDNEE